MSRENVQIVCACFNAWREGDFESALSYYADEAAWQTGSVDSTVYRGRDGIAHAVEEWTGAFSDYWLEPEDLIDAGDRVVFLFREGGVGRTSGVRVEEEGALVFTLADGRIVSAQGFTDRADGLRAAGLDPS